MTEAVVLDFPLPRARVPVCTAVRSTLLGASVLTLRRLGLFDRYIEHLPARHHPPILYGVAGQWLPIALGAAHYTACAAMGLAPEEVAAVGGRSPRWRRSRSCPSSSGLRSRGE